ncbi:cation-transporting ATPase 13A3-like isoform X2 [Octopus vulgaris]|uniref:Cation-transporting ATPase n=1 Tax=Octopus vulgaris TaxID=6645 RepID=A0AA36BJW7_OCTVU|nr:cation-transporting ATPase 13A3-like isoform X2 [Octopus vulgaris]
MNLRSGSIESDPNIFNGVLVNKIILNKNTDDQLECIGYKDNTCKKILFYLLVFFTLGFILLIFYWEPKYELLLKKSQCPLLEADAVLLKDSYNHVFVEKIKFMYFEKGCCVDLYHGDPIYPENITETDEVAALVNQQYSKVDDHKEWSLRYFDYQYVRYIWDIRLQSFKRLEDLSTNIYCKSLLEDFHGLSKEVQTQKREIYGSNDIIIEVKSYWKLLIYEILNPFYIFQIASIILWAIDVYYYYAGCIFFISCMSISISLYETHKQSVTLHDMVTSTREKIRVRRSDERFDEVDTNTLVPGDVIAIPAHGCVLQCDAVLITGTCIINESMLTGESVPVTKTQLSGHDNEIYSPAIHKKYTLFAGTNVLQTRYYGQAKVLAVVVRTGFNTAKGELIRAILFPKPLGFKFYNDALKFLLFLCIVAICGMGYSTYTNMIHHLTISKIIIRALDIITIVVPPALPAAMTVGMVYAQNRLKKRAIFCISPPRINFCGKLDLICFDKTGTLTEDGLDLWAVIPTDHNQFQGLVYEPATMQPQNPLTICMASCHSLTMIDGELSGDPLDLKMFLSLNWVLDEPGKDTTRFDSLMPTVVRPRSTSITATASTSDLTTTSAENNDALFATSNGSFLHLGDSDSVVIQEPGSETRKFDSFSPTVVKPCSSASFTNVDQTSLEVGIVRQFTFTSSLQRMSVIVRTLGTNHMDIYSKGAPEKIASLCNPDTIPADFSDTLHKYTVQGFRVLALSWKELDPKLTWHQAQRISREKVEHNLNFLGLLIMKNTLKPESAPVIKTLQAANIRSVMVTGDMILTAVSVARNCGMVKPKENVIIVNASPPEDGQEAQIHWEQSESVTDDSLSESDQEGYHSIRCESDSKRYHFAVSGKAFSVLKTYFPQLLNQVCERGTIFARMSPDQKAQLVEKFQELEYGTGFCGDGANDCEALKAAHAGISLSETEASVAAPFTSKNQNIECVVSVIKEGRAALVTSFGCFKYMALYSIIQFVSVLILYTFATNLADFQFLYIDLIITTSVAVLMGYTQSHNKLAVKKPAGSLIKLTNIFSILSQILVAICFQTSAFLYLQNQSWYKPVKKITSDDVVKCSETTLVFLVSSFQYIFVAFAFSKGPPHRKLFYTNVPFTSVTVLLVGFTLLLLLHPFSFLAQFFQMVPFENTHFKTILLVIIACNAVSCLFIEFLIVDFNIFSRLRRKFQWRKRKVKLHKKLDRQLHLMCDWPPVGNCTYASDFLANNTVANSITEQNSMDTSIEMSR